MVANILIAIGFFFTGVFIGAAMTIKEYQKALTKLKKSGKHFILYEL